MLRIHAPGLELIMLLAFIPATFMLADLLEPSGFPHSAFWLLPFLWTPAPGSPMSILFSFQSSLHSLMWTSTWTASAQSPSSKWWVINTTRQERRQRVRTWILRSHLYPPTIRDPPKTLQPQAPKCQFLNWHINTERQFSFLLPGGEMPWAS